VPSALQHLSCIGESAEGFLAIVDLVEVSPEIGELLALRQPGDQAWRLARLDGLQLDDPAKALIGALWLTVSCSACLAVVVSKQQRSSPQPALLLHPAKPGEPPRLISTGLVLKVGSKLLLEHHGRQYRYRISAMATDEALPHMVELEALLHEPAE
jgi:hypothetical protein